MEHRREKFLNLAEKRTKRAIKDIRLIGNLSNKNNYIFEPEDVSKIVSTLEKELRDLKGKFRDKAEEDGIDFSLR